jgi:hypothetical protein
LPTSVFGTEAIAFKGARVSGVAVGCFIFFRVLFKSSISVCSFFNCMGEAFESIEAEEPLLLQVKHGPLSTFMILNVLVPGRKLIPEPLPCFDPVIFPPVAALAAALTLALAAAAIFLAEASFCRTIC